MVRHHDQRFGAKPQPLHLHGGCHHFKGLARTYLMSQQGIPAVHDMSDGVDLMGPKGDLRVHARKADMTAVILTGPNGIKGFVVDSTQPFPSINVFPDPFGEFLLDQLLPILGNGSFLFVENRLFVAVFVLHIIKHTHIPLVQGLLQNLIGIHPLGAVGGQCFDIAPVGIFLGNGPLTGSAGAQDFNAASCVIAGAEGLHHKFLVDIYGYPVGTDTDADLSGGQVNRLHRLQCFDVFDDQRFLFSR